MFTGRAAAFVTGGLILLLFATPLRALWARDAGPWWLPFVAWSLAVALTAIALRRRRER